MSNSKSRHLAGCIVLSLILVSLAGIQPMLKVADTAEDYRLDKDTLHCAVALAGHLAASEGRGTGLSNEMLQYFGDFASATVEIVPGNSSLSYLDSLKEHKIDILVLDHPEDNIPEISDDKIEEYEEEEEDEEEEEEEEEESKNEDNRNEEKLKNDINLIESEDEQKEKSEKERENVDDNNEDSSSYSSDSSDKIKRKRKKIETLGKKRKSNSIIETERRKAFFDGL